MSSNSTYALARQAFYERRFIYSSHNSDNYDCSEDDLDDDFEDDDADCFCD